MPFKSKKQAAFLHEKAREGTLPKSIDLPEWDAASKGKKLPTYAGDPMKSALGNVRKQHAEKLGVAPKMKAIASNLPKIRKKI